MIVVAHAFSRQNAGDGLLVDLTIERLERIGIPADECVVVALDPESFDDLPLVARAPGDPFNKVSGRALRSLAGLVRMSFPPGHRPWRSLESLWNRADGIVAVGGGYLHSDGLVRAGGTLVNHIPQILLSSRSSAPIVYLPQSIGPLVGRVGRWVGDHLADADLVCVRDDRSLQDVRAYASPQRIPDLAILELANAFSSIEPRNGDSVVVVPRRLSGSASYEARLRSLLLATEAPTLAVQADVPGPKSDRRFIEQLGGESADRLEDVIVAREGGVVISVRLHGALQALLSGWPAIHLAYDRKGFGAFEDLGISPFVHDAGSFDVPVVVEQLNALLADPSDYWAHIESRLPALQEKNAALDDLLSRVLL